MHKTLITLLSLSSGLVAAQPSADHCAPRPGATCNRDDCTTCYCLGPVAPIGNAPVCPYTCDGDISISVSGLLWVAHQDGLEYAILDQVRNPIPSLNQNVPPEQFAFEYIAALGDFNRLVNADYISPHFKWDFGFRLGLSYCHPCDGWDVGVQWTWFRPRAHSHIEAETSDNQVILPLWSAHVPPTGGPLYATDAEAKWQLDLNLIDLELGRQFWTSRYVTLRPHVGLRIAFLEQTYTLNHRGGAFGAIDGVIGQGQISIFGSQDPLNNQVKLENDFHGVGVRAGLNTNWHLGCGWALYGESAASLVYGRFKISHSEHNRLATDAHEKFHVLDLDNSFRASRAMLDLGLGVQWMAMICDCKYGFLISLGWEEHLFFHQNQFWRGVRVATSTNQNENELPANAPNQTGENVFHQRRGTLDTQGLTLKIKFDF